MRERGIVLLRNDVARALRPVRVRVDDVRASLCGREIEPLRVRPECRPNRSAPTATMRLSRMTIVPFSITCCESFIVMIRAPVSATTPCGLSAARVMLKFATTLPCVASVLPLANSSAVSAR